MIKKLLKDAALTYSHNVNSAELRKGMHGVASIPPQILEHSLERFKREVALKVSGICVNCKNFKSNTDVESLPMKFESRLVIRASCEGVSHCPAEMTFEYNTLEQASYPLSSGPTVEPSLSPTIHINGKVKYTMDMIKIGIKRVSDSLQVGNMTGIHEGMAVFKAATDEIGSEEALMNILKDIDPESHEMVTRVLEQVADTDPSVMMDRAMTMGNNSAPLMEQVGSGVDWINATNVKNIGMPDIEEYIPPDPDIPSEDSDETGSW
tara:strand:- start:91205 stop:91999 length:795 start_codon:yes stop_codon:yes gene_type:complete